MAIEKPSVVDDLCKDIKEKCRLTSQMDDVDIYIKVLFTPQEVDEGNAIVLRGFKMVRWKGVYVNCGLITVRKSVRVGNGLHIEYRNRTDDLHRFRGTLITHMRPGFSRAASYEMIADEELKV